jgi:glycerophosphoryl diester phosphodiesterase
MTTIPQRSQQFLKNIEKGIDILYAWLPRFSPTTAQIKQAKIVAHRGAHDHLIGIQENTISAFQRALDIGCWGVELDVHQTIDKILIVNHDPDLKRLWNKSFTINKTHFKTLRKACEKLPSLDEVITQFGKKIHLFIEIKAPFYAYDALEKALQPLKPAIDYHLICLDAQQLSQLTQFPKRCLLLVPVHNNVRKFVQLSLREKFGGVLGNYLLLRKKSIKTLNKASQIAGVGFVDSRNSLYRELNRGLSYLFTNNALGVMEIINKRLGRAKRK